MKPILLIVTITSSQKKLIVSSKKLLKKPSENLQPKIERKALLNLSLKENELNISH